MGSAEIVTGDDYGILDVIRHPFDHPKDVAMFVGIGAVAVVAMAAATAAAQASHALAEHGLGYNRGTGWSE